jgi:membrane protein DedA with SNARE-associated domain
MNPSIWLGLALGTFVSEDLTSISAGLLARDGTIDLVPAIVACAIGVYVGDLGLWCIGRVFGRRALGFGWVARRIDAATIARVGARVDANLGLAVLGSRFLPGSRLPMYLAVGVCGQRPLAFAGWSLLAVLMWTPMLVWLARTFGEAVTAPLLGDLSGALRHLLAAVILLTACKVTMRVCWFSPGSRT